MAPWRKYNFDKTDLSGEFGPRATAFPEAT
jgi:hypothetical protein